jgi:ABC-type multidrug transport system ATPase subunit
LKSLSNGDELSSGGRVFEGEDMLLVRDLVKIYPGPVTALAGVDLDVPNGMFGLLGPNGAGKTTLMRILAGLLEPTSGTATLDGEPFLSRPERIWGRLGYLPQDFGFFPHLTGERMLEHVLRLKGISVAGGLRALCHELLERVNLSFAARRKVKTYSGGMRQRLGIAQAIAGDPRLIIVDEPTAGLDPEERLRFYRLLSELAADRIVLLSTHIVEDVAVLCSRFAVIRAGRLIAYTSPAEARMAIEGAIYEGTLPAQSYGHLQADPERCVTQAYLVEGQNRVRVYQPTGQPPAGFVPVATTLEDAYLVLIKTGYLNGLDKGRHPQKLAHALENDGLEFRAVTANRGGH